MEITVTAKVLSSRKAKEDRLGESQSFQETEKKGLGTYLSI
jgi:hypothetical protein